MMNFFKRQFLFILLLIFFIFCAVYWLYWHLTPFTADAFVFADTRTLPWIRKTIMTKPANGMDIPKFYSAIADAVRENIPFPVKLAEALAVVEVCDIVKSQSPIYNKELVK